MGAALPYQDTCCTTCDDPNIQNVPGPTGADGIDGDSGLDGVNAYTTLTDTMTMPAKDGGVVASVKVGNSNWMAVGQVLYIANCGWMRVDSITDSNTIDLENLETTGGAYAENVEPTTVVPIGSILSPGGLQGISGGISGSVSGTGDLDTTTSYPNPRLAITTNQGDLIVNTGNTTAPRNDKFSIGTTGQFLRANTTVPNYKMEWASIDLNAAANFTNQLPVTLGGTGATAATAGFNALSPVTTKGDIIVRDTTNNVRLAVGATDAMLLQVNSAAATGLAYSFITPSNFGPTAEEVVVECAILREVQNSGTAGTALTATGAGVWKARVINQVSIDTEGLITTQALVKGGVTGTQFQLPAGYFRIRACAVVSAAAGFNQLRIYNVSSGGVAVYAGSSYTSTGLTVKAATGGISVAELDTRIVSTSQWFSIEHWVQNAAGNFGEAATTGTEECYLIARIEKLAKA